MTTNDLVLKHGEYISPEVKLLADGLGPRTQVLKEFKKQSRGSDKANAFGGISNLYAGVIEFQAAGRGGQHRGLGLMFLCFQAWMTVYFWDHLKDFPQVVYQLVVVDGYYLLAIPAVILAFFTLVVLPPWLIAAWQLDMFAPNDEPTLFDRSRRKVYRLMVPPGGWGWSLKPIQLMAVEYDWDAVSAQHRAQLMTSTKTVSRVHSLTLLVRAKETRGDVKRGQLLDVFSVGNSLALGENTVPVLWEHIRRFMDEKGPALVRGDVLSQDKPPSNVWQSMGAVGPFGPKYFEWLSTPMLRGVTVFMLVFFPFTLPFTWAWAVCNWISHLTVRPTVWPQELRDRLGAKVSREEVERLYPPPVVRRPEVGVVRRCLSWLLYLVGFTCAGYAMWLGWQGAGRAEWVAQGILAFACLATGSVVGTTAEGAKSQELH